MQLLPRRMAVWWRWQDNKVADWPVCIDKTARWPHQHAGKACCWWFFVVVSFLFLNFLFLFLQFFSTFATPAKYSTSKQRQRGDKRTRRMPRVSWRATPTLTASSCLLGIGAFLFTLCSFATSSWSCEKRTLNSAFFFCARESNSTRRRQGGFQSSCGAVALSESHLRWQSLGRGGGARCNTWDYRHKDLPEVWNYQRWHFFTIYKRDVRALLYCYCC